ncbi:cytochrome P450 [Rhodopseudomonas palustris]|uniref:cytochrome P450 n=1 Tax=Rhodopseudomonas palustris TaxID=1076 RepID=UPI002ACD235F|nr:cytochrome P450 [Rhodopseudomonas palustris]WQH00507.1 cytochrome P450 [Rhodopseudomonas palustris]
MVERIDDVVVDPVTYGTPRKYDDVFAGLRRNDPVRWTEPTGYRPFWTVAKHSDILEIERQNDKFINDPRLSLIPIEEEDRRTRAGNAKLIRTLVNMDEPDHRAYRGITQAWFMPMNLRKIERDIEGLAREFVALMGERGGRCDFVNDVALWYPLRVIMTILGVPREDDVKMLRLTQALLGSSDKELSGGTNDIQNRQVAAQEFFRYFGAIAEERRRDPKGDLASVIANASVDGKSIGVFESLSYYLVIATAGHDTTSSVMAGGLHALIEHPAELRRLRESPDLLNSAVEEILRWTSPVKHFFRTATQDYQLRGKRIRAGDSLMLCFPSGNRDEEVFDDPFAFRIDRAPNRHIAFGHGVHQCLGLNLARMELKALFKELLAQVDSIELSGEPAWIEANLVSGPKRLPIRYRMKNRAEA